MSRPGVVAEVREARSGRDDERVVGDRAAVRQDHHSLRWIEPDCLAEQDGRVLALAEYRAQRLGNIAGTHGARRDLVEERLEQVEVAAIDERDLDTPVLAKGARRVQAPETAADDDDAVRSHGGFPTAHLAPVPDRRR
jgi:hypothetical protein